MSLPVLQFDHYYKHDEIVDFMKALVAECPELASMESIGTSAEGRDIWCLVLTNQKTGPACEKPAMYVDGNIHAGEVTASHVCLYTALYLLQNYETNEEVKTLLDRRTWYIIPRVNPDGAELYLTSAYMLRSVTRENPDWEPKIAGALYPEDLDNDGVVRFMRVKDACGLWKVSDRDTRLLIPREPGDFTGDFYSIHLEGLIHEYDGGQISAAPDRWHLDTNRNFPNGWQPNQGRNGAFPLSEPETLAMAKFVHSHPNIGAMQAYHTMSGAILRPSSTKADRDLPRQDVDSMNALGAIGEKITGYPCVAIMEGFLMGSPGAGIFVDWAYDHMGVLGFTTELWDPKQRGGITGKKVFGRSEFNEEHELAKLKLNDEQLEGNGFMNWTAFTHPQLGEVEIGGWHPKYFAQNPWFTVLEDECHKNAMFSLKHCGALPELVVENTKVTHVEGDVYTITVDIANIGWLPTQVTERGVQLNAVKPIRAEIKGEGLQLVSGKPREEIGQLEGYRLAREGWYTFGRSNSNRKQRARISWTVRKGSGPVQITINAPRAGVKHITLELA